MQTFPKSGNLTVYVPHVFFFSFYFHTIEIPSATDHPDGKKQLSMTVSKASNEKASNGYKPTTEKEPILSTLSRLQSSEGIWPCSDLDSITLNAASGMIISLHFQPVSPQSKPLLLGIPLTCTFYCYQG